MIFFFLKKVHKIIDFFINIFFTFQELIDASLKIVHDIQTENLGFMCILGKSSINSLKIPLNTERYDGARQKADLAATVLQDIGFVHHTGELIISIYLLMKIMIV